MSPSLQPRGLLPPRLAYAAFLLACAGGARLYLDSVWASPFERTPLLIPLSEFPMHALGPRWKGRDAPLPEDVRRVTGVTDYVRRSYTNGEREIWFYVGYVDHWDPAAIHHPDICFPATGLYLIKESHASVPAPSLRMDLSFKESLWGAPRSGYVYSLTSFYFRGEFRPEVWQMRAHRWRGVPYFAIVTLSTQLRGPSDQAQQDCFEALGQAVRQLVKHFPE